MIKWYIVALTTLVVVALAAAHGMTTVALGACIVLALIGPARAVQALTIATLINYANPAIIKLGASDGVLLRVILIFAVLRILPTVRVSDLRLIWPVWLFGLLSGLTSLQVSPAVGVSIMKVITFTLAASAVLVAFNHLPPAQLRKLQSWLITVNLTVIALSALTLAKPGLGAGANGGLQGLLDNTQALGIFVAPFAAWSVTGVLLMRRKASSLELWIAIGTVAVMLLTRARTGAAALIIAILVVMLTRLVSRRLAAQATLGRPVLIVAIVAAALLGVAFHTGKVSAFVTEFLYKGTEQENRDLSEAYYASRGGGVVQQWLNFRSSPLIGHGFGVYPSGEFPSGVMEVYGIPISAPVEKGFLPTAILEEGGIVGAAALAFLIAWLARYTWRNEDLRWRAMFVTCIAVNVGECVFLAPGGIGMLTWIFLGLSVSAARTTAVATRIPRRAEQPSIEAPLDDTSAAQRSTSIAWSA